MKLVYSELALQSLEDIVYFLKARWTTREIKTMEEDLVKFERTVTEGIIKHPKD